MKSIDILLRIVLALSAMLIIAYSSIRCLCCFDPEQSGLVCDQPLKAAAWFMVLLLGVALMTIGMTHRILTK